MNKVKVQRGDIFLVDFGNGLGSEQSGVRPVVIIQNDIGNYYSPTVIVAAITGQISKRKMPTHIELKAEDYGLEKDSLILMEQIRTIDRKRIIEKVAVLDDIAMSKVNRAIEVSLGLIDLPVKPRTPQPKRTRELAAV